MNYVFIACSLDGYIADKTGGLDWLNSIPNPQQNDMGYACFMERVDAIIMGKNTFEMVIGFDVPWPYTKPVFVLSKSMKHVPKGYDDKVKLMKGSLSEIIGAVSSMGYENLYIDGGKTIHNFLKEDLIDELIITTIPVLLGGGIPLFGELNQIMEFKHIRSELFLNEVTQVTYKRKR